MAVLDVVGDTALIIAVIFVAFVLVTIVTGIIVFYFRRVKRYKQFQVVIWEEDGFGQLKQELDDAGIFKDFLTKNKRLFLKKNKVGLNPDNIPYIQGRKHKTIYMYKSGLKNFHYIDMKINPPSLQLSVGEEDVNWALNEYHRQKVAFQYQSWLAQYLPVFSIVFASIIILILFMWLFRNFGVIAQAGVSFDHASQVLADASMRLYGNQTIILQ